MTLRKGTKLRNDQHTSGSIRKKFIIYLSLIIFIITLMIGFITYKNSKEDLETILQKNLSTMSTLVHLLLTNSMMTGRPESVIGAEQAAKEIEGVKYLDISRSQVVIDSFGSKDKFTKDRDIIDVFRANEMTLSESHDPDRTDAGAVLKRRS